MIANFDIFGKTVSAYMLCALAGVLLTLFFLYRRAKKTGLDEIQMLFLTLFAFGASLLGSHLLYGALNFDELLVLLRNLDKVTSVKILFDALSVVFGGSVYYGGLLGILLVTLIYTRKKRLNARYWDLVAVGLPLFHTFGRLGCFLSGCCFGMESSFGFVYHHSLVEAANGVRRLPVQLFEVLFNALLCLTLSLLDKRGRLRGKLMHVYLYAYPIFRFVNEFFRGDAYRGFLWGLSTSQWISLLLLVGNTVVLLLRLRKQRAH